VPKLTAYLVDEGDGVCRIRLAGELDLSGREIADDALRAVDGASEVVLDLSELEFIDSMGIHFVVLAYERAQRAGYTLTIVPGGPQVTRVFSLVGLDGVLPFADAA
jgi:anti-anti-sigma factor